jgi:TonB family protein
MRLNEHERASTNVAGLTSPVQQAEMKLLLAGRWPPLKPLPVFKFESDEYRASVDFDKTRGEWICRKTALPSNKVQELRGGLTEITMALPHGQAEAFAECAAAEQPEQELEKDASRRLQAILEWRANYENGALYSGLQDYLSESQQNEIDDSIRLTLTARQLQFNPKNVAYVFDALSKADGKLAALIEIAQRNKAEQGVGVQAKAETAAFDAERHVSAEAIHHTRDHRIEGLTLAPIERLISATLESFPEEPVGIVFPEQDRASSDERIAYTASQASNIVTPEILEANPPSFVEDLRERMRRHPPVADFAPQIRTDGGALSAGRIQNSPSRLHVLEISGFQVAAVMFLFAAISLAAGLTVGRGPLGKRLPDTQKSMPIVDAMSPDSLNPLRETSSRDSTPLAANTLHTPEVNPPGPARAGSRSESPSAQPLNAQPEDSATRVGPAEPSSAITERSLTDSDNAEASPGRKGSTGLIARNAAPLANSRPARSPHAVGPISGAPANPAPRRVAPATRTVLHLSSPSTMLVTGAGDGSKPFWLILPETPIAASSSFAMTSQLSVFVSPERGPTLAPKPSRLQAGELDSFVWPRYPRLGDRHGSSETVKVRTTIGKLGQVLDIRLVSGSISLLPSAMSAIRLWRYKPTLLNKRAIQVQRDVTIEFRPPQY